MTLIFLKLQYFPSHAGGGAGGVSPLLAHTENVNIVVVQRNNASSLEGRTERPIAGYIGTANLYPSAVQILNSVDCLVGNP